MTDIAIRAEHLSKLYQIGRAQQRHDSLRDAFSAMFRRTESQSAAHDGELWALRDVCFSHCGARSTPQSAQCDSRHAICAVWTLARDMV